MCDDGIDDDGDGLIDCDDADCAEDDACSIPEPVCGNGIEEEGEECDDSNTTDGDGCSAVCVVEYCGDGIRQE